MEVSNLKVIVLNPLVVKQYALNLSRQLPSITGLGTAWLTGKNPPQIGLMSAPGIISPELEFADIVPCVFTGYTEQDPGTYSLFHDTAGVAYMGNATPVIFTAGVIGTPDVAVGVFMFDVVNSELLAVELFDAPFNFNETGDEIQVYARFPLPSIPPSLHD
jgi:hypothetical protein